MKKLYYKSELAFSIGLIIIYIVFSGIADNLSVLLEKEKLVTAILHIVMSTFLLFRLKRNSLFEKYGICKTKLPSSQLLYYIPLLILSSANLFFGVKMNMPTSETVFYVLSMISVGFLEELIFRGFLFKAMAKDSVRSAVIVSSLTFGIGHIINLINGNAADLLSNLCQIVSAAAFGFLFVVIFLKTKSLIPCIISHSAINVLSAFSNEAALTPKREVAVAAFLSVGSIIYALIILKKQD